MQSEGRTQGVVFTSPMLTPTLPRMDPSNMLFWPFHSPYKDGSSFSVCCRPPPLMESRTRPGEELGSPALLVVISSRLEWKLVNVGG